MNVIYSQLFRTVHSNIDSVQHKISLDVPMPFVIQRVLYYGIIIQFPYLFIDFSLLHTITCCIKYSSTNPHIVFSNQFLCRTRNQGNDSLLLQMARITMLLAVHMNLLILYLFTNTLTILYITPVICYTDSKMGVFFHMFFWSSRLAFYTHRSPLVRNQTDSR